MSRNNMNNNLLNRFQTYHHNTPFSGNPLLNNNPLANSKDASFYNKINMAKLEQIKKARNIDEIGLDKKQISDLVICPIVVSKTKKSELDEAYNEIIPQFIEKGNKYLEDMYRNRTNAPYKNVIKKDLFNKNFKKYYKDRFFNANIKDRDELLIHKITDVDSDSLLLEAEYELLTQIIEKHNDELQIIYSSSKKNKYKKEFEFVQNYRRRLEYNPKNSEELKEFYEKEQRKINKDKRMIDDVISLMIENDQLSAEELERVNLFELNKSKKSKTLTLEEELRNELGDNYEEIINSVIDDDKDYDKEDDKDITNRKSLKKPSFIKVTSNVTTQIAELKPRKKITVKTEKHNIYEKVGNVSEDIKNKYKNRQN